MMRVITAQQLQDGYYELRGCIAYHREYRVIMKTEHGTYFVHEPEVENNYHTDEPDEGFSESDWSGNL